MKEKMKMKVKELYEFLKSNLDNGTIQPETEVITVGEYNYGESLGKPYIDTMNLIDEDKIVKKDTRVVAVGIGAYLYESEDLGYSRMWVDEKELQDLIDNNIVDCEEE
jgi:hypothetical protein